MPWLSCAGLNALPVPQAAVVALARSYQLHEPSPMAHSLVENCAEVALGCVAVAAEVVGQLR